MLSVEFARRTQLIVQPARKPYVDKVHGSTVKTIGTTTVLLSAGGLEVLISALVTELPTDTLLGLDSLNGLNTTISVGASEFKINFTPQHIPARMSGLYDASIAKGSEIEVEYSILPSCLVCDGHRPTMSINFYERPAAQEELYDVSVNSSDFTNLSSPTTVSLLSSPPTISPLTQDINHEDDVMNVIVTLEEENDEMLERQSAKGKRLKEDKELRILCRRTSDTIKNIGFPKPPFGTTFRTRDNDMEYRTQEEREKQQLFQIRLGRMHADVVKQQQEMLEHYERLSKQSHHERRRRDRSSSEDDENTAGPSQPRRRK